MNEKERESERERVRVSGKKGLTVDDKVGLLFNLIEPFTSAEVDLICFQFGSLTTTKSCLPYQVLDNSQGAVVGERHAVVPIPRQVLD